MRDPRGNRSAGRSWQWRFFEWTVYFLIAATMVLTAYAFALGIKGPDPETKHQQQERRTCIAADYEWLDHDNTNNPGCYDLTEHRVWLIQTNNPELD